MYRIMQSVNGAVSRFTDDSFDTYEEALQIMVARLQLLTEWLNEHKFVATLTHVDDEYELHVNNRIAVRTYWIEEDKLPEKTR